MTERVSIEGLELAYVQQVLFMNSWHYKSGPPWTEDIMNSINFSDTGFDPTPYDQAHKSGYAARVVERYRQTGVVERFFLS